MIYLKLYDQFPPPVRQFLVALGPILITICLGMTEGYSAILLPQLENNPKFKIDEELASWIASIAALPMGLGCILGGFLMEKIGRKSIHWWACYPSLIGWLLIYFAQNLIMILMGRFLTGFCVGLLGPPTGVYMSETSSPKLRGFFLASISFAIATGLFLSHFVGSFISWQNTALVCCVFPILALISMLFVPESPTWLAKHNRMDEAKEAFLWCRGDSDEAKKELTILVERQQILLDQQNSGDENVNFYKLMTRPEFYKPLIIVVMYFIIVQWSGLNAITFYSVSIIQQTVGPTFNEYIAMIIIDIIRVVMSLIACILLKRLGRRTLTIISGTGIFVSLFVLSLYTYLSTLYPDMGLIAIPLIALILYVSFMTIGFVPLPWTLMGEIFPLANRGTGSTLSALSGYTTFFSVVKTTPHMFTTFGPHGTFLIYGLVAFFGTIYLYKYLPETKDKPLHQIEDHFKES